MKREFEYKVGEIQERLNLTRSEAIRLVFEHKHKTAKDIINLYKYVDK
jgi:hypothetical protein